jgi:hypothetical protein
LLAGVYPLCPTLGGRARKHTRRRHHLSENAVRAKFGGISK